MRRLLLVISILSVCLFGGGMKYSDPKPSFDHPRKIFMKLNTSDIKEVNHLLGTVYNLLRDYPSDTLKVEIIAYGPGMRVLKKDYDKHTLSRVHSLMEYDVDFIGCRNTMKTMNWTEKDLTKGIALVQAGLAEVIERQVEGWVDATPY